MSAVVARLSLENAGYIAGLVDGEGTIALSKRHRNERRQPVVSISSTECCILDSVAAMVGVGKITRKRIDSTLHAPGLTYSLSNRQALDLLGQICPFLRSYKRRRARLVLDHYLRLPPRNGKYLPAVSMARLAFETEFAKITARD